MKAVGKDVSRVSSTTSTAPLPPGCSMTNTRRWPGSDTGFSGQGLGVDVIRSFS
ncbi:hypothetical protein SAMN05421505_107165 [Sinosporangium album]|uniref:Uncharacterized protein n=1 Tax=Sinosporangium album TaxID=504805 RepID=A0A1G7WRR1_9ACTN|nr:hypothetical protein SAMN05421505_107165 [Sinosporangium album]